MERRREKKSIKRSLRDERSRDGNRKVIGKFEGEAHVLRNYLAMETRRYSEMLSTKVAPSTAVSSPKANFKGLDFLSAKRSSLCNRHLKSLNIEF